MEEAIDISLALEQLNQVFRFGLQQEWVPDTFRERFQKAARRFSHEKIDPYIMGYGEEIGDMTYQLLKLSAARGRVLTKDNYSGLYDRYARMIEGNVLEVPLSRLYEEADEMVADEMLAGMTRLLPRYPFPGQKKTARAFLANQYLSYLSRAMRLPQNTSWAYHSPGYLVSTKIPEESAELIEVLNFSRGKEQTLDQTQHNLYLSTQYMKLLRQVIDRGYPPDEVFTFLNDLIHEKLKPGMQLEDILDFTLFKIRGRHELTFQGYEHRAVMQIAKPVEYLLEADLVH